MASCISSDSTATGTAPVAPMASSISASAGTTASGASSCLRYRRRAVCTAEEQSRREAHGAGVHVGLHPSGSPSSGALLINSIRSHGVNIWHTCTWAKLWTWPNQIFLES